MSYADLSIEELVRLCAEGNDAAWEEFVRRCEKIIAAVVTRVCHRWGDYNAKVRDDLVQDTFTKFCEDNCRILREFESRHPDAFLGMLKVVARNLAHDYFRSKKHSSDVSLEDVQEFVGDR